MTMLKICGVKDPGNLDWLDGTVDYIGFVYSTRGGSRSIDPGKADSLASTVSRSRTVLVIHGAKPRTITKIASRLSHIRVVQLHDQHPPGTAATLSRHLQEIGLAPAPVAIWSRDWTVSPCSLYKSLQGEGVQEEYLLVDRVKGGPPIPPDALQEAYCTPRLGIAGGMDPERACSLPVKPYLIDASSWPEYKPGLKDPGKVLALRRSVEVCL